MFNSSSGKMQFQIRPERGNDGKNIMKNAKYPILNRGVYIKNIVINKK